MNVSSVGAKRGLGGLGHASPGFIEKSAHFGAFWHIFMQFIVRPANRDWACQRERCHTLSNKTSLQ